MIYLLIGGNLLIFEGVEAVPAAKRVYIEHQRASGERSVAARLMFPLQILHEREETE
jgi:hypothetical protein